LTAVVIAGAALELRHIAAERSELLTVEREYGRRLTELADLKADFTAMVAHELGSPIAAIRRSADILTLADLALPQTLAVRTIAGEADVLNALVADVQAIATLESEAFAVRPRPVALDQLFAAADAFASALPGAHPVHVSAPRDVRVLADPERIGQVLRNLLHNAARYAADRTPIELRARLLDGRALIEVADSGPGIHPADLTRIFNKFERGHGAQGRQPPGAGLGLYLSSRIVEAHGARLTAHSTLGEGSVFAFILEVAA
jgi:signal transduction histidine kinase